ncbi:MAG: hypothetical protein ACTS7E_02255 [Arsenophonus sp. NC-CH8-MAG3]
MSQESIRSIEQRIHKLILLQCFNKFIPFVINGEKQVQQGKGYNMGVNHPIGISFVSEQEY